MKLNYKRTFLVGFAFLSICAFWQLYDSIIPLILRDTYGVKDGPSGIIMSLDNIVALFLLPLFGTLSDRAGRRIPFIVAGTAAAVVFMMLLPLLDNAYGTLAPAPSLILFIIILGCLLLSMGSYRSPAVALMPDVTPKPLRSKANAIINLMGALGGAFALGAIKLLVFDGKHGRADYFFLFLAVAILMAVAVITLTLTIREKKLVAEMKAINYGVAPEEDQGRSQVIDGKEKLPRPVFRSLLLILLTVMLWFFGYNAITTAFTKYATTMWSAGLGNAATCLLVATVGAIVSYVPIGMVSSRIGRKKTILIGLCVAVACMLYGSFCGGNFSYGLYIMFLLFGFAQAAVTVNTFPMVWEISRHGNVGKYTGYYYTCSMAAQVVTPILSGYMLQLYGYQTLFPYGAVMIALAILPIAFTKYGDSKPDQPHSKLEAFDNPD